MSHVYLMRHGQPSTTKPKPSPPKKPGISDNSATLRLSDFCKKRIMPRMAKRPDIHRLLEFQQLLVQFQGIARITHVPGAFEQENDTEHSYNLALTAWFLASYFPKLDRDKLIRFALIHDLVEIHAGDTYIYADQATLDTKVEREAAALKKLEHDWPDFPDLTAQIHDYEQRQSDEAKFIYALDKIMPIMLIFLGQGHTWQKEGITPEQLHNAKRHKVALSKEINPYYEQLYELLLQHPHFFTGKPKLAEPRE